MALQDNGTVWVWGYNGYGQLGDGTTTTRLWPQRVGGLPAIQAISVTEDRAYAVGSNGDLYGWGYSTNGLLGSGAAANQKQLTPNLVSGLGFSGDVRAVTAASDRVFVQKTDGRLYGWGHNESGQLGDGTTTSRSTPVVVLFDTNGDGMADVGDTYPQLRKVSAFSYSTAAVDDTGKIWTWGSNQYGQLGNNTTQYQKTPYRITDLSGVTDAAVGSLHMAALNGDAAPWGWGYNYYGQLGRGNTVNRLVPVQAKTDPASVAVTVQSGAAPIAGAGLQLVSPDGVTTVQTDGTGAAQLDELPPDTYVAVIDKEGYKAASQTVNVTAGATLSLTFDLQQLTGGPLTHGEVDARDNHTAYLDAEGNVFVWGYNYYGQLGNGTNTNASTPSTTPVLSDAAAVSVGSNFTVALKRDGTVWAWGYNSSNVLGVRSTDWKINSPQRIPGLTNVKAIAAGNYFIMALKEDGTVWSWGSNDYGELGDGTTMTRTMPVQVPGLTGVTAIAAGDNHALAVAGGAVWAWGYNGRGQLGDASQVNRLLPVQVSGIGPAQTVSAGQNHSAAVLSDGTLWQWGGNYNGQFGIGTTGASSVPVQTPGLPAIQSVSTGNAFTLALTVSGTVYGMGANYYGQLGDGSGIYNQYSAVPLLISGSIVDVDAGDSYSVALRGGDLFAWGYNGYGQVGDGTTINRMQPVQIGNGAPASPVGLQAAAGNGLVTLTWTPPGDPDVTSYKVYWKAAADSSFTSTVIPADNVSSAVYTVTGLVNETPYVFAVSAIDGTNLESAPSLTVTAVPTDGLPAPLLSGTVGNTSVILTWSEVSGAEGYEVFMNGTSVSSSVYGTSYSLTDLTNGTHYQFGVRAYKSNMTLYSVTSLIELTPVDLTPPSAPTGVTAEAMDSRVLLRWDMPPETDIAAFIVYVDDMQVRVVQETTAEIGGLTNGQSYSFTVKAKDANDNLSAASTAVSAVPQVIDPTPHGTGSITVRLTPPDKYAALSFSRSGYQVTAIPTGSSMTPATVQAVTATDGTVSFVDLAAGEWTFSITDSGKLLNPGSITVTVMEGPQTVEFPVSLQGVTPGQPFRLQNIMKMLIYDINGDGAVDRMDALELLRLIDPAGLPS
jgi:alpha-tubulin suppressor-like RCC1 family protein